MVDVRLITLLPPAPPVSQPPAAGAVTTQGSATIVPQLPAGSILSGFIINRDGAGNPILRTDKGDVTFSSNFFLKIGSEVVIRIQNAAGHPTAHIVSVNGEPPEAATQTSGFDNEPQITVGRQQQATPGQPQANNTQTSQAATAPQNNILTPGRTISAIVITPPQITTAAPNAQTPVQQPLPPGTSLLLDVVRPGQPHQLASSTQAALAQLTPDAPDANTPAPQNNALASLLPKAGAAQPQTSSPLSQILSQPATPQTPQQAALPLAPNAAPPAPATATPLPASQNASVLGQAAPFALSNQQAADSKLPGPLGQTIIATAIQQNDDGSTTLSTPLGTLRAPNLTLPQGEQVNLRVSSMANPNSYTISVANNAAPAPLTPLTQLSRSWPAMAQITQLLGDDAASKLIPNFTASLPTITVGNPENLSKPAAQILFFMAALGGGNFREWMGAQNIRQLEEKGYGSLVKKAEGEFMQLARQFGETLPNNWQSMYFPVMASGELTQVRAFFKREKKKDENEQPTGEEDTRFVLEMELSQLGEMQLDGLVKRKEKSLQFDLVVRSLIPLEPHVEKDIHQIYTSTAELTGFHGQLVFQSVHAFPVHPMEEATPHPFGDVVV